jgi:hypothetical protein
MEPAGTAVGSPDETPTLAAEIVIVLMRDPVSDDTADGSTHVAAGREHGRGWLSQRRARRSQRSK